MTRSPRRRALAALVALASAATLAGCAVADVPTDAAAPASPGTAASSADTASYAAPSAADGTGIRIVTIGDSLMSGYGLGRADAWPELVAGSAHVPVVNLACGGMGFVAVGDCGTTYSGLVPAVLALAPEVVVVQSSSNDFDLDPAVVDAATLATMQELRDLLPGTRIIALSTIWNDEDDVPGDVAVTSDALARAAEETGADYVDVGQPLAGHPEWMQDDDVHPNAAGQQALAAALAASIASAGALPTVAG